MAQRLPTPGGDNGDWGDILNAFLEVSHNPDGSLANDIVGTNQLQNNAVTNAQLDSPTQTAITKANNSVQSINSMNPDGSGNVALTASDISAVPTSQLGVASGIAQLGTNGTLKTSQLPSSVISVTSNGTNGNVPIDQGNGTYAWGSPPAGPAGTGLSNVIDLMADYGAKFDGTTDDTVAWQNAINSVKTSNGGAWIHVPPHGISIISSTIDATKVYGCTISARASGGSLPINPEVRFTGTTGPMFAFYGAQGIVLDGITFAADNAAFNGDLIAFDWPATGSGSDSMYNHVQHCGFRVRAGTPNSLIRMNKVNYTTIEDCLFLAAGSFCSIMFGNNAANPPANQNNQYTNVIQIQGCQFNQASWAGIYFYALDMENIVIRDCGFEGCPGVVPLTPPTGFSASSVGSGGSFSAGTYYWRVTALNSWGETVASNEVNAALSSGGSANLTWAAVTGASGYNVYRATTGNGEGTSPALVATINSGSTTTYVDTGTATTAGKTPTFNTTGGGGAISAPIGSGATYFHCGIEDCWFGDASGSGVPWINQLKSDTTGPCHIWGCTIFGNGGGAYPVIAVDGLWSIKTCYTEGPLTSGWANAAILTLEGNEYNVGSNPFIVAAPAAWQTQSGRAYSVPSITASLGDPSATVTWNGGPFPILGGKGLQVHSEYYGGAGIVEVTRYLGALSSGPPTDARQTSQLYDWYGPDANGHFWVCTVAGSPGTFIRADHGNIAAPAYGTSVTPDFMTGCWQSITVTNATPFAIAAPNNSPSSSQTDELVIEIYNNSGGSMGTISWNSKYVFAGQTWTNPATGMHRYAKFQWNGANWICTTAAESDY